MNCALEKEVRGYLCRKLSPSADTGVLPLLFYKNGSTAWLRRDGLRRLQRFEIRFPGELREREHHERIRQSRELFDDELPSIPTELFGPGVFHVDAHEAVVAQKVEDAIDLPVRVLASLVASLSQSPEKLAFGEWFGH